MSSLWVALAPVLLAAMMSPARTLAVIILLHTPRSWRTASAFVVGMVVVMMLQGIAFGLGMSLLGLATADRADDASIVAGVLYVIGGVLLLTGAYRFAVADAPGGGQLAGVMRKLESVQPRAAMRIGGGWLLASPKQWVFVNTAVAVIYAAQVAPAVAIGSFLIFTILSQLAYAIVIVGFVLAHDRVSPLLDAAFAWLRDHLQRVVVALFSLLGVLLVISGVTTLA